MSLSPPPPVNAASRLVDPVSLPVLCDGLKYPVFEFTLSLKEPEQLLEGDDANDRDLKVACNSLDRAHWVLQTREDEREEERSDE